jgi:alpha-L-fucosidase
MNIGKVAAWILAPMLVASTLRAQPYEANWESLDKRPVPQWFPDAKFGIFIHWGVYAVPSWAPANADIGVYAKYAEWYWNRLVLDDTNAHKYFVEFHNKTYGKDFKYQDFAGQFKAELFDPNQWADVFQRSGAKYVILTSKHHEGFTLWPSAQSWNWNSVDVGPHRDICGDLSQAVKAKGLKMGFYYSLYEWFNPLYKTNFEQYVDYHMIPQMKDLVSRYHPDIFWPDGEWDYTSDKWKSEQFLQWLFNESPVKDSVTVNDRWGKETRSKHGGYYTTEYGLVGEQTGLGQAAAHPWEECRGIGTSFGYNRVEDLGNYSSSKQLVELLIAKVSEGGNLLLDIGPTADGRIPVIMQERLLDMGNWLKVNGSAIYGTAPWKDRPKADKDPRVFFTTAQNTLYVICTRWPVQPLAIPSITTAGKVSLLGSAATVHASCDANVLTITAPTVAPDSLPCEYAWVFKVEDFK